MGSSSLTRDQTRAPCIVSKSLSHWSTRGVPWGPFSNKMSKMQVVVWNRKYLCSGVSAVAERPPRSSTCVTHLSSVFIRFTHLQHCFSFFLIEHRKQAPSSLPLPWLCLCGAHTSPQRPNLSFVPVVNCIPMVTESDTIG